MSVLCDDDLLLQTHVSPSNKLMDKSRTEAEILSTLRWWSVPANRCASFNEIDGQVNNWRRKFFYFAMMICCCWWISVLQGHLLRGREPKETRFQDCGDQLLVLIVCVLWVNLASASWRKQELFLSFLYTIYLLSYIQRLSIRPCKINDFFNVFWLPYIFLWLQKQNTTEVVDLPAYIYLWIFLFFHSI